MVKARQKSKVCEIIVDMTLVSFQSSPLLKRHSDFFFQRVEVELCNRLYRCTSDHVLPRVKLLYIEDLVVCVNADQSRLLLV